MRHITSGTNGVCAVKIDFDIDDENRLHNVLFTGGCNGNLKAIGTCCCGGGLFVHLGTGVVARCHRSSDGECIEKSLFHSSFYNSKFFNYSILTASSLAFRGPDP